MKQVVNSQEGHKTTLSPTQLSSGLFLLGKEYLIAITIMHPKYFVPLLLPAVQATKVLLPLYVYPSWQGWWNNVYTAIATNPNVTFQVILNPSNGPGGSTPGYNSDWVTGVTKLNSYPNVLTLGYVYTSYSARPTADVQTDVAAWAGWNTYTAGAAGGAANISVHGIFFDEVPNWTGPRGRNDVAYMAGVTAHARSQFTQSWSSSSQTVFYYNVGTKTVHAEYFSAGMADSVVVYENYASAYRAGGASSVLSANVPAGMANKSSILLHDFGSSGLPASNVESWLRSFQDADLGSANILGYGYDQANTADGPADIGSVARILST